MRTPDFRPSEAQAGAVRAAIDWWRERFTRRKRPAHQTERDEFLAYAWTMREWTPEQIRYVASSVLERSRGHWPDHAELEEEFRELQRRASEKRAASTTSLERVRWSGREDDACPHCQTMPAYAIEQGTHVDHWIYRSPACSCCGVPPTSTPSLWLRGIPARPEDDPRELAEIHRGVAVSAVREWRSTGKAFGKVVGEFADRVGSLMHAQRMARIAAEPHALAGVS